MFELETAIQQWRRRLAAAGVRDTEVLDELEGHLREDIQHELGLGIELEAAFAAAVERIGGPEALQSEYRKATSKGLWRAITDWLNAGRKFPLDAIAQQSLVLAQAESSRYQHNFIGTEHLLLGLLQVESGVVSEALERMGVERQTVRAEIEKMIRTGALSSTGYRSPLTPRVGRALALATKEAKNLNQEGVGIEAIFLGLLLEGTGVAAVVLRNLGISAERARNELGKRGRG